ncbi:GMC oxidoreductase [Trametes versicolor FP-101664 SS1]|uniref:GMC oxidoreductase n=1 Tax=Trametes versicolor (strain FP-101664) TaxID=717944 RepID=UPI00046217C0|nr:GMC oxidoreductase [Trametes versicolor FP-101664 SS1]EIW53745.1 GMC oxidoreductase [Trametes versicolor FP-101664 SS1]
MDSKLSTIAKVSGKTFDFVIIGGSCASTAGLALAARLSENCGVSVAVLEAGKAHLDDELVLTVQGWQRQFMNPEYDWKFPTVPQQNAKGKTLLWSRGKGLGGSSAMNFLMWSRPQREDVDAFEALGNPDWNWERFYEYSKKTEKFCPPSETSTDDLYNKDAVGSNGPLSISFARTTSNAELPFRKSLRDSGITLSNDALSGSVLGAWKTASVIDPVTNTRSYATNAYLLPAVDRPNLHVLTEAYVTKIITSKSATGEVVASGVEFQHDGTTHIVHVAKEAILSAGAIKSPQILELSGIGDRSVLEPLGVQVQFVLPSVGTNVQEHITHNAMAFLMHEERGIVTSDLLRDPAFLANFVNANPDFKGLAFTGLNFVSLQSISSRADEIIRELEAKFALEAASYPPGLKEQYEQQLKHLKDPNVPDVEIMVTPFSFNPTPATKPIIAILPTLIHPFSRGTIHAASADPTAPPAIDPHYFAHDADLAIFTEAWKFARKVAHTGAFSSLVATEVAPGPAVKTDEQIREYVRNNFVTTWHTCGSLSMLPQDKGGVVDPKLKVYGTQNIRVVDLSIVPLQITSHTQALVYAIAEQAADIIKHDHGLHA